MREKSSQVFIFEPFVLDLGQKLLTLDNDPVKMPARTFEVLAFLVENNNRVVSRDEVMSAVWGDVYVEEANLSVHISNLRKVFNGEKSGAVSIETFPKKGYRIYGNFKREDPTSASNDYTPATSPDSAAGSDPLGVRPGKTPITLKFIIAGAFVAVIVTIAGLGYSRFLTAGVPVLKMSRVRGTEKSISMAISPDGQYIAHEISDSGKRSLNLTHLASGGNVVLLANQPEVILDVTFSKDGSQIYYTIREGSAGVLYKVPFLGGEPRKVIEGIDGAVSFSPDESEFVFVRKQGQESILAAADSNGNNVRRIAAKTAPDYFSSFEIAWSPDGKLIAAAAGTARTERKTQLVGVDPATGAVSLISEKKFTGVDGLQWLPDGSGLVMGGFESTSAKTHLWLVPFPSGEPRQITSDPDNYGGISLTADGKTILAGQFKQDSGVWVDSGDGSPPTPVTLEKHHEFRFISWTPDDKILFGSSAAPDRDIWVMNADGTGIKPLTARMRNNIMPVGSGDGRYVVFSSNRAASGAYNIWRMGRDGTDPLQLTHGDGEIQPVITPDGRWVFYTSGAPETPANERRIWKVSIDGGDPDQVVSEPSQWPDVSADGNWLAFAHKPAGHPKAKIAVMPIGGGDVRILDVTPDNPIHWLPSGKDISFVKTSENVSNLWAAPVDGGQTRQLTQFVTHQILNHDWADDGRLFCSRSMTVRDAFLITNFR